MNIEEKKERARIRAKEWYRNNKQRAALAAAEYRQKNKDKIKEYRQEYRKKNKVQIRKKKAVYREKNADLLKINKAAYYQKNKTKIKRKSLDRYKKNKTLIQAKNREYSKKRDHKKTWEKIKNNPVRLDHVRQKGKEYRNKNKDKIVSYQKKYRENNKDELNKNVLKRKRLRPEIKLKANFRSRLYNLLKGKTKRSESSEIYLGCSIDYYRKYIESLWTNGMSWDNYGRISPTNRNVWNIDHIKELCHFDLTKEDEIKQAFHYKNTRPLWAVAETGIEFGESESYQGNLNRSWRNNIHVV